MFKSLFRRKTIGYLHQDSSLRRSLTAFDLTLMGIGAIIGAGVFVLTGIAAATKHFEAQIKCEEMDHQHDLQRSEQGNEVRSKDKDRTDSAAQFKVMAESFQKSIEAMAKSIAAPRSIKIDRDKTGRVAGATG